MNRYIKFTISYYLLLLLSFIVPQKLNGNCFRCSLFLFLFWVVCTELQESLKRPISGSDFGFEIPLKSRDCLQAILSNEQLTGNETTDIDGDMVDAKK